MRGAWSAGARAIPTDSDCATICGKQKQRDYTYFDYTVFGFLISGKER